MIDISELGALSKKSEASSRKLFQKLKKSKPRDLDDSVQQFHEEVFAEIDCLKCANCCRTTSPIFYDKDIERLSRYLKIKPSKFTEQYLHIDEDGDYVLNMAPCPFLDSENYCGVYDARPAACREYPHTDRKRFYQILDLTLKNTAICPAAYAVVEKLKEKFR